MKRHLFQIGRTQTGGAWSGRFLVLAGVLMCPLLACPGATSADLIRLKSGGELRGKLMSTEKKLPPLVTITTVTGAMITVDQDQIAFVTRRPLIHEEYELKSRLSPNTVEAHWELAEWCVKNRLSRQRELQLEKILRLDPDHEAARKGLGYLKKEGKWTTHEESMLAQGYVRYRGRYITPEERDLLENSRADRELQREWFSKVHVWSNLLSGRRADKRKEAVEQIRKIQQPQAIPALKKFFAESQDREFRLLYVHALERIGNQDAVKALLEVAVLDNDQGIRSLAVEKIPASLMSVAGSELIQYLQHEDNLVVRRAGTAMKNMGDPKLVPYLIEALVTNHHYRVPVELAPIGFHVYPGGMIGSGMQPPLLPPELEAGLLTGLIPPENVIPPQNPKIVQWVTVRVPQQNPEVLEALREMTLVDFGYDKRTWKLWLLSLNS